ncbi:hypothetical protein KC19_6G124200 [Ceratodon purpureus]|uniref:Uncharacterized protein n=1 Tax=Ceratodon purpureus TaxID=3225 RepID=A0A8T0HH38_CERPU|nr:hypothetical protein KC19_6G124200 [Ceratodon purpureus]
MRLNGRISHRSMQPNLTHNTQAVWILHQEITSMTRRTSALSTEAVFEETHQLQSPFQL